jgi:predicted phage terminase large subunit-like protein
MVASRGKWRTAIHLMQINQALLKLERGEIKKLALHMPPRHGKTEFCTKYFPVWALIKNPDWRVITTSYGLELASRYGRLAKEQVEEFGGMFGVKLNPSSRSVSEWDILNREGGMIARGVGGGITGRGANLLIVDDPIKNHEEALSETYRNNLDAWYQSTAASRLEPDGRILKICTRWHEDDLAGRVRKRESGEWTVINFPAISHDGKALWPTRYNIEHLEKMRSVTDPQWWEALYQQTPGSHSFGAWPEEYFTDKIWVKPDQFPNRFEYGVVGVDPSKGKSTKTGDYSAIVFMGLSGGKLYVDATVRRRSVQQIVDDVLSLTVRYAIDAVGVEALQFQELILPNIQKRAEELRMACPPLYPIEDVTNKLIRIERLGHHFRVGDFRFLDTTDNRLLVHQCREFPAGAHDDGPDALEMARKTAQQFLGIGFEDGVYYHQFA